MTRWFRLARPLLVGLAAFACGGESRSQRLPLRPSLLESDERGASVPNAEPGWRYHPSDVGGLVTKVVLRSGDTLFAGQRGERWLVRAHAGKAEAAAELAPEELVAIVPPRGGRDADPSRAHFLFVGKSGTTYEADSPLGSFSRSAAPLEPLVRVREGGGVLMGLRRDGALARSDTSGATWSKVGPDDARFEDVALRPDGRGLALAIPEALFESRDFGATWKRTSLPQIGVTALVQDDLVGVVAQTAFGLFRYQPDGERPFVPLGRAVSSRSYALGVPPPLGPSADALVLGRAVVVGPSWIEARSSGPLSWSLVAGSFGRPLSESPLAAARGCEEVFLSGYGADLYLACARQKGEDKSQPIEFQRSTDGGKSWSAEPYYVIGRTGELRMAVGAGGALVVTGVCPTASREAGCMPSGVHRRQRTARDSGPEWELMQSATPSLVRSAYDLAFALDGKTLFAVGRRFKSDSLAVFVSHDAGSTFEARDVEALRLSQDEDELRARQRVDNPIRSAAAGADGTASFVVAISGRESWLVVDDDGRAVSVAKPPVPNAHLGAAGAAALAFDAASRDVYESLDAGANYRPIGKLPVDPCPGSGLCEARIACTSLGCVIGGALSRVGFRVEESALLSPPQSKPPAAPRRERRFGALLNCTLAASEWQKIPMASALPSARDAAIGKLAWFTVASDPRTASGSVFHMKAGSAARLEELTLLDPARAPAKEAFFVSPRNQGAVAIRYAIPSTSSGPELKHVEVAWDDVPAGRTGRGVVENGGAARPSDYGDGKGHASPANVALLDLAAGGVYLRLHGATGDDQPTLFVTSRSVESIAAVRWPDELRQRGRSVTAHLGAAHVPLRFDTPVMVRARSAGGDAWSFDAMTLGWNRPAEFDLIQPMDVARFGDRFGVHVTTFDTGGSWASGLLYPLRGDGALFDAAIVVPTQLDLPSLPRACGAADRSMSPRVVVAYQPGTRHPVLVTDPIEPIRVLLTKDAVLYGSPSAPCVAAYEAVVVPEVPTAPTERALIMADTLERSWLFRVVDGTRDQPRGLEYRAMACRFDPNAEVPPEARDQNGALVAPR